MSKTTERIERMIRGVRPGEENFGFCFDKARLMTRNMEIKGDYSD